MSICQVTPSPPPQGAVYTIQWSDCKHGAKQFWHSLRLPDLIFCCRFAFPEEVMLSEMKGIECVQSAGQTVWKHWQNTTIQPLYNQNWTLCVLRIGVILPAPPSVKSQCSKVAWGVQGGFFFWHEDRRGVYVQSISAPRTRRPLLPSRCSAGAEVAAILFFCCCDRILKASSNRRVHVHVHVRCWGECHTGHSKGYFNLNHSGTI